MTVRDPRPRLADHKDALGRKALSYQAAEAMTLAWFQVQGLVPLLDRHLALQAEGNCRGT